MAVRRILAVAVALLLVAGALGLRNALDDDDDDRAAPGPADTLRLTCATELAPVCRAVAAEHPEVEVSVEAGLSTLDDLVADGAGDRDGWLTLAPLPQVVDDARDRDGRAPVFAAAGAPLARSPLVLVVWDQRAAPLEATCGAGGVAWPCIGEHAGETWTALGGDAAWGEVKPGHGRPDTSAAGLLVLAQAAVARAGTADLSAADLDDAALRSWLRRLEQAVPTVAAPGATPLSQALAAGPSTYDVVGTTEAEAAPALARSARGEQMTILYPAPMATADVVYAPVAGAPGSGALDDLLAGPAATAALAAAGWRTPGDPRTDLPATTGLPAPDVLEALRTTWAELVR